MTATPINNDLFDLYHQILLLARGLENFYRPQGVNNLISFFKDAKEGNRDIYDLLEHVLVRRSRFDIKREIEAGKEYYLPGPNGTSIPIRFPKRSLHRIDYHLESTYAGLYGEIIKELNSLIHTPYNLERYKIAGGEET